jgi:hypothetical protein
MGGLGGAARCVSDIDPRGRIEQGAGQPKYLVRSCEVGVLHIGYDTGEVWTAIGLERPRPCLRPAEQEQDVRQGHRAGRQSQSQFQRSRRR